MAKLTEKEFIQQHVKLHSGADIDTMDEHGSSSNSYLADSKQNSLHGIDNVKEFMLSAQSLSNLRKEFRAFRKVDKRDGSKSQEQKIETQEGYITTGDYMTEFQGQICIEKRVSHSVHIVHRSSTNLYPENYRRHPKASTSSTSPWI